METVLEMMIDELKSGAIDDLWYVKTLDENQLKCLAYQYAREYVSERGGLLLEDFLETFDFGYTCENGKFRLIDYQHANLGGVEDEEFEDIESIVDRLDIYYQDYIINDLRDEFDVDTSGNYEDIYNRIKDNDNARLNYHKTLLKCILNPTKYIYL